MDVLSEVLRAVRLTGAVYFQVDASHPWVSMSPPTQQIGTAMMPSAGHVMAFHIVLEGRAWAVPESRDMPPACVEPGDILIFPSGSGHIMSSDSDSWDGPRPVVQFYFDAAASESAYTHVAIGGNGERTQFVCGYFGCDSRPFNPLLGALPGMLVVKERPGSSALMKTLLAAALDETSRRSGGADALLARLSELMFVQAMRQHMAELPDNALGWLAGLRDENIGRVLTLMHSRPSEDWSLESLARASALSRSALAERFAQYVGEPPMHYLARWRMQLAAGMLSEGASIGAAADDVGYRSEAAFQRAFKKYVGVTVGEWRRRGSVPEPT